MIGIGIVRISQNNNDLWRVALMETPEHQQAGGRNPKNRYHGWGSLISSKSDLFIR